MDYGKFFLFDDGAEVGGTPGKPSIGRNGNGGRGNEEGGGGGDGNGIESNVGGGIVGGSIEGVGDIRGERKIGGNTEGGDLRGEWKNGGNVEGARKSGGNSTRGGRGGSCGKGGSCGRGGRKPWLMVIKPETDGVNMGSLGVEVKDLWSGYDSLLLVIWLLGFWLQSFGWLTGLKAKNPAEKMCVPFFLDLSLKEDEAALVDASAQCGSLLLISLAEHPVTCLSTLKGRCTLNSPCSLVFASW